MAAGGRGRSQWPYLASPLDKRRRCSRDDDDNARSGAASPKRRKRRYGDEVEDGEILDGASAARDREHERGWRRGSRVVGGGCDERSSSHSRLDRRGTARDGRRDSTDKDRRSRVSDADSRHRDSTWSSKYSTSGGYKQTLIRFGDIGHKIPSREAMNKGTSFQQDQDHQRYKEKTELTILQLQQQNDAAGNVDASKAAAHLQDSTSGSMANSKAENNRQDSQEAMIIDKANITVGKPPAASRRPPVAAAGIRKSGKPAGLHNETNVNPDNWDDADGYYVYRFGELLGGRYEITTAHGKGVFSRVVGAKDTEAGTDDAPARVAIKIIRNNDTMYSSGKQEISILQKLNGADRDDKQRHCVRFISSFRYRNHLCLVLESLHMNLREVLKKFGPNIGLKLTAVKLYAKQMFIALKHLKTCRVLHCDIKPDNIMVNQDKNVLKLCDFGNAMLAGMNQVTPYLVSRFYRAPEIILGLPYDHPLDMWSVGCCLFELCTGKILFRAQSNNEMLRLHMELKGPFPKKMLRIGAFTMQHFDRDLRFQDTRVDPVTGKVVRRSILNFKPKGIGSYISDIPKEDPRTLSCFKDLLDKMFVLDPAKRITVEEALSHPFITGK